jgi:hypothetical protein
MRLLFAVFSVGLVACGGVPDASNVVVPDVMVEAEPVSGFDASAYDSHLAAADASDGTVDHVVTQCAGCGLGMSGDPAHSARVGDYEMHLCSDSCQANFVSDPALVLGRLPTD